MANDNDNMQPPGAIVAIPPSKRDAVAAAPSKLSWEGWCADKAVPLWKGEAARHGRAWPVGQEVTEDEFNQALYDAFNSRIG